MTLSGGNHVNLVEKINSDNLLSITPEEFTSNAEIKSIHWVNVSDNKIT